MSKSVYKYFKNENGSGRYRISGRVEYNGFSCQQMIHFDDHLEPILKQINPSFVIEIGTGYGGFTSFLSNTLPAASIVTYEVDPVRLKAASFLSKFANVTQRTENVFGNNYENNEIAEPLISDLLKGKDANKTTLVMCDGSNKVREVCLISPWLRVGDYIMWHDYAEEPWRSQISWPGFEVNKVDVERVLLDNGFEFVNENLQRVVWGCARKIR